MADRPHSRKVKIVEGNAEVRKGERVEGVVRASEREHADQPAGDEKASGE